MSFLLGLLLASCSANENKKLILGKWDCTSNIGNQHQIHISKKGRFFIDGHKYSYSFVDNTSIEVKSDKYFLHYYKCILEGREGCGAVIEIEMSNGDEMILYPDVDTLYWRIKVGNKMSCYKQNF